MHTSALIPIIISTISTVIAVIGLFMTRRDMIRRDRKDEERFVAEAYQNFQELHLAFLQDSDALQQLASDRQRSVKSVKLDSIASLWINQAFHLFQLFEGGHLSDEEWVRFQIDMKGLFSRLSIKQRWEQVAQYYPLAFQSFVKELE